jgi:hypothetical protein
MKQGATASQLTPEIMIRSEKPAAMIISLDESRDMLARREDTDDMKTRTRLREKP